MLRYNDIYSYVIRLIRKFYPRTGLKKDDWILSTYPKSGTTWLRFIFANIISLCEFNGETINYDRLNGKYRCSYDSGHSATVKYSVLPRIYATHLKYRKNIFSYHNSIYLYRHPGDTMVSFYEYRKALRGKTKYLKDFHSFIRDEEFGLCAWCSHFLSWIDKCNISLSYENLSINPVETISKLLKEMNIINLDINIIKGAVTRASFKEIRKMEDAFGLDQRAKRTLEKDFKFAREGKTKQYIKYFSEEDIEYMINCLKEYNIKHFNI